ncbi:hypothetical protein PVNG_02189 [Plasmodium vivax North Korean]|uniref:Uncharacterized protein n=1 Tax=Plasmodium vivax North Korean TaxID=1035514 RepID=A0A0J9TVB0_PLAVI|nr:hypothetical protein PVNG_02189 [Plasmodium vivax North Korean]
MILEKFWKDTGEYNNFCLNLLNNLGHYSKNQELYIRSHYRCNILYNWIYNQKKKHGIQDEIINKCFEEYIKIGGVMKYNFACSYDTYNKLYEEPINMTLLNIFEYNMETIRNILNVEKDVNNISSRKFVCKAVQIYKDMYQKYCVKGEEGNQRHKNTCSELGNFKYSYANYFFSELGKEAEIPSLDDIQNKHLTECQKYLQVQALVPIAVPEVLPEYSSRNLPQDSKLAAPESLTIPKGVNQSSPMSSTVSTALGTVAGASSMLALLYKVTLIFV